MYAFEGINAPIYKCLTMWLCGFLSAYCYSKNWMFAVTQVKQKLKTQSQLRAYSTLFILYLAKEHNGGRRRKQNFSDSVLGVLEDKGVGSFSQRLE